MESILSFRNKHNDKQQRNKIMKERLKFLLEDFVLPSDYQKRQKVYLEIADLLIKIET